MGNCFDKHATDVAPAAAYHSSAAITSISSDTATGLSENSSSTFTSQSFFSMGSSTQQQRSGEISREFNDALQRFTYADLRTATKNFSSAGRLGEGGFGTVYKGYIDEKTFAPTKPGKGITVAVKKLNVGGMQGHKEWVTEMYFLGALRHPNLVKLIGFCAEDCNRLLVYEYMTRGSLENHLFSKWRGSGCLSWEIRMKIALHTAEGLKFLHDSETHVIYRDFKAANILLDDNYNAKLSDFGLAKDGPTGDNTHVSTRIMGTYGYAAPEYLATGHLSIRSDVYSFGVVLLELLTGRPAMDPNRPPREQKLVEWAKPHINNKKRSLRIMDPNLQGQYSFKGAQKIISLAVRCLNEDPRSRPTMKEVVDILCAKENPRLQGVGN